MADIRINSLPTTASASSSDDFLALDGATNGTRKLNAYSPTFGGNLTVSGTGTIGATTLVDASGQSTSQFRVKSTANGGMFSVDAYATNNVFAGFDSDFATGATIRDSTTAALVYKQSGRLSIFGNSGLTSGSTYTPTERVRVDLATGDMSLLTGNLTVSGGTITGGTSGLSLASGGTNQNITLTPSGTGVINSAFGSNLKLRTSLGTTNVGTARIGVWYNGYVSNADYAAIELAAAGASGGDIRFFTIQSGSTLSQKAMLAENGNFLVGGTIDGGQKLQVSGTAYVSGATTIDGQFKSNSTQEAQFGGAIRIKNAIVADAASAGFLDFVSGATRVVSYGADNSTAGTFSLVLRSANSSVSSTALSFDTSSNATFAGKITATSSSQGILSLTGSSSTGTNIRLKNTGTNGRDWGINSNATLGNGEFSLYDYTAGYESFRITGTSSGTVTIYPTGGLIVENGPIKTAAPSGGTAGAWKLGIRVAATTTLDTTQYLQVDIGGTLYKVALVTS